MPTTVAPVPPLPERGEEAVLPLLAEAAERRRGLLLVVEPDRADAAHRALQRARLVVPSARAVLLTSDAAPLARTVLVRLAGEVGRSASLGHTLAAWEVLEADLVALAALRSVAALTRPSPGLGAHVRSWWPPSSFVVHLRPAPSVLAVGARGAAVGGVALPGLPAPAMSRTVVLCGDPARSGRAGQALVAALTGAVAASPAQVSEEAPAPDAQAYYGAPAFEVVHAPSDLAGVLAAARDLCTTCAWCGQHSPSAVCPVCADATALSASPPTAVSASPPAAPPAVRGAP